jgi:ABC-type transporter Mla MlaB component
MPIADRRRVSYALTGALTDGQVCRLEALLEIAVAGGKAITLDLSRVWRIDRTAADVLLDHVRRPDRQVRLEGLPAGLGEWLQQVSATRR